MTLGKLGLTLLPLALLALGMACGQMAAPMPTAQPAPTATVTPMPTPTVTPAPTSTATPRPTPTNTPMPTVTPKPTATATPAPTATPVFSERFSIDGPELTIGRTREAEYPAPPNNFALVGCYTGHTYQGRLSETAFTVSGSIAGRSVFKREKGEIVFLPHQIGIVKWMRKSDVEDGKCYRMAVTYSGKIGSLFYSRRTFSPHNSRGREIKGQGLSFILIDDGAWEELDYIPHKCPKDIDWVRC